MMLSGNPRLREIRRLHDEGQTGVLSFVNNDDERVEVVFREGLIDAVSVASSLGSSYLSDHRLGHYLVEYGSVPARDLGTVESEAKRRKIVFGEAAVRRRLVEKVSLGVLVRRQAVELIQHVLENSFPWDSFAVTPRLYSIPAAMNAQHLLLELARRDPEPLDLEPGLRIALSEEADLSAFPWYPQELAVLGELGRPKLFGSLLAATELEAAPLRRILCVLERLGVIETMNGSGSLEPDASEIGTDVRMHEFPFERLIPIVTHAIPDEKLRIVKNGSSFTSEQFKTLKVQIDSADSDPVRKVVTVSSPDPEDGKSLVSASLAACFAMDPNRRVAIVDCDLRNPALDKYLGVSREPGLLQYVSGHLSPFCYLRRLDNLFFLTTGGLAPNPVEVLSMNKMTQLIEYLRSEFDTVILDAPPYSPIADARLVTGLSDGVILVIRQGKSSYGSTERAFKAIDPTKWLGVVFNDVKSMPFHTYENYGYYRYGREPYAYSNRKSDNSVVESKNYLNS